TEFVPHLDGDSDNTICYLKSDHTLHQRNDKDIKLSRLVMFLEPKRVLRENIFYQLFLEKKYIFIFLLLYIYNNNEWRGIREVKQCPKQRRRKKGADVVDKIHRRDLPKIWNMSTCITTHMIKI
ncbi:unnamed protein product, partial [Brassica rapa subsp. trilocularis]